MKWDSADDIMLTCFSLLAEFFRQPVVADEVSVGMSVMRGHSVQPFEMSRAVCAVQPSPNYFGLLFTWLIISFSCIVLQCGDKWKKENTHVCCCLRWATWPCTRSRHDTVPKHGVIGTRWIDWLSRGLTSYSTLYRSFRGRFLQARWPNQQRQSTEGRQWATQISFSPTRTTPLCYNMN